MYILEFSIKKNSISLQLKIFQIKYKTKNHFFSRIFGSNSKIS